MKKNKNPVRRAAAGLLLSALILCFLAAGLVAALVIVKKDKGQARAEAGGRTMSNGARLLAALMAAAVFCECATAVLMQRNIGWDFAYYIGNMTTSVATDTMYVYDGSSGLMRSH